MSTGPNTCDEVLANISRYLDRELNTTACDAIERHCLACASCAALVTSLRETVGLCRQAGTVPLPEDVRQRARESVRRLLDQHAKEN